MRMQRATTRLALSLTLLLIISSKAFAENYKLTSEKIGPGLDKILIEKDVGGGETFEIIGIRINPDKYRLDVIYVPDALSRIYASPVKIPRTTSNSRAGVQTRPTPNLDTLASITAPVAALNAGFRQGSWSHVIPAGLLFVDGEMLSFLNKKSRVQTGVLCVNRLTVELLLTAEFDDGTCDDAVQAGPFIIDPGGKIGISADEPFERAAFPRSFICMQYDGNVVLAVTPAMHLRHLAEMLLKFGVEQGLNCERALNLGGDIESGLIIRDMETQKLQAFGETQTSLASAIIVRQRDTHRDFTAGTGSSFVDDGKEFILDMVVRAVEVFNANDLQESEKDALLLEIALDSFAVDDISRFVLARKINTFTNEEYERFKELYSRWLIRKYVASLYDNRSLIETFEDVRVRENDDQTLLLETEIGLSDTNSTKVKVSWELQRSDHIRIVDVRVEGISMINTHRSDFSEIIFSEGPKGLLARLDKESR